MSQTWPWTDVFTKLFDEYESTWIFGLRLFKVHTVSVPVDRLFLLVCTKGTTWNMKADS